MVRAADRDTQPSLPRQTVVNRLDVPPDPARLRIGPMDLVAQYEHERLMQALPNHAAEWLPVHIDACLAPQIVVAKLQRCCPAKGVAKHSHARHVETAREPAR